MDFDPKEATKVTARLNTQANSIVRTYTLLGFLAGGGLGLMGGASMVAATGSKAMFLPLAIAFVCSLFGLLIGRDIGESRALMVRYYAHSLSALIAIASK